MKLLIIGGNSVAGTAIIKKLKTDHKDFAFTYKSQKIPFENGCQLDITDAEKTIQIIHEINPDVVFLAASLTSIDLCETKHELANAVNVDGTKNVSEGCKEINCKLAYISTSFVFDGTKKEYFEEDDTSPATFYGYTKLKGEELVKSDLPRHLILRTDALYGWVEKWNRENSATRAYRFLNSGTQLREVKDWYNTPTYIPDFVNAALSLINNNSTGIFHLSGSDFVNRTEWSIKLAEIFSFDKDLIVPIHSSELNLPAKRVSINLKNNKIFSELGIRMKGIEEGLLEMKKTQKQKPSQS